MFTAFGACANDGGAALVVAGEEAVYRGVRSFSAAVQQRLCRPVVLLLLVSLVLFALAASTVPLQASKPVVRALIVFDITQSMNVQDMRWDNHAETRLEAAKQLVRASLNAVPCGSELGVGIFTGHRSFVLFKPVEACAHYAEISSVINDIDWRMAWAARSEVAKGIHSGLLVSGEIGNDTRLIFITDGHEAPPVNPDFLPRYKGTPGDVKGAILGVGDNTPLRIPKYDPNGRFIGYWRASEVQQIDSYSAGRPVEQSESMSGVNTDNLEERIASGKEHLSSLKENYLRSLSERLQLEYSKVSTPADMQQSLLKDSLSVATEGHVDISRWIAALALMCLLASIAWPVRV